MNIQFSQLSIGEYFRFAEQTPVGCGKYNGIGRKISSDSYRMGCFAANPEPTVQVIRTPPTQGTIWTK